MKVAIHSNPRVFDHSTLWNNEWVRVCEANGIDYAIVDLFSPNALATLHGFSHLLWHFGNYSLQEMLFARSMLLCAEQMGLIPFPNHSTSWHFDDKVAQMYLLQSAGSPIPDSWMFATMPDYVDWLATVHNYPLVAKLRSGSGSSNVKLLRDHQDALGYGRKMFGHGVDASPSIFLKTISNISSSKDARTLLTRARRLPEFLRTKKKAREFPRERGYVYLQDFVPNDGYDVKLVVIGEKASFITRMVRPGDFRASGGGRLEYDRSQVPDNIIRSAFATSDALGFQCMGYDYVIDSRSGIGKIVEMSYGFAFQSLAQANGHWDRNGTWHNEPLVAPSEVLMNLI